MNCQLILQVHTFFLHLTCCKSLVRCFKYGENSSYQFPYQIYKQEKSTVTFCLCVICLFKYLLIYYVVFVW